jgi:medium-chain acyl-[acyl-carrier-protein] hydrolase
LASYLSGHWFVRPRRGRPESRIRLVLLPFAGANPTIFRNWGARLGLDIDIVVLQLPGRGQRLLEPPLSDCRAATEAIAEAVWAAFDIPVVFFGHSLGAILAFETIRCLRRRGRVMPAHLFVSGFRAPDIPDTRPRIAHLEDADFIAELRRLGGTPAMVLENEELMNLMIPGLRADFRIVETYEFSQEEPLLCPITAFAGTADGEAPPETMAGWARQTKRRFSLETVPGSHFFPLEQAEIVLTAIRAGLDRLIECERDSMHG